MEKLKLKSVMHHVCDMKSDGGIVCSDPCYDPNTWCAYQIDDNMSGEWSCYSSMYMDPKRGYNISSLTVVRKGYEVKEASDKMIFDEIGVDSGTCGFFDKEYYNRNHAPKEREWYDKFVSNVVDEYIFSHKVEGMGVWTQTAHGDGTYQLYADYDQDGETIIRLTVLYDWVEPEVIHFAENEDELVFPYECYNSWNKILRYVRVLGEKTENVWTFEDQTFTLTNYIIDLKEPVECKRKNIDQTMKVTQLRCNNENRSIDVFCIFPEEEYGENFGMWYGIYFLDDGSEDKLASEIERQLKVDKKKLFWN